MPANHRRRTSGLAAAALAALATAGAAPAGAAPAATGSASAAGAAHLLAEVGAAAQESALEYWTPERLAAARPASADAPAPGGGPAPDAGTATTTGASTDGTDEEGAQVRTLAGGDAPLLTRRQRSTAAVVTGGAVTVATPWTGDPAITSKVGRLFFTQGGLPYECSASSVEAGNESVVVTAGHCLSEAGHTSTNVIFVPGLAGSEQPYGRWSATRTFTTPQWLQEDQRTPAALNHDVGFVVLGRQDGTTLADRVGALDLAFDAPLDRVTVFGYPAAGRGGDGSTLQHCTGWRFPDTGGTTDQGTLCDMGGGSSGGPWLSGFDPAAGTGTVTSVVSFSYSSAPERLYGPRLGAVEREVYEQAAAVVVP
ncbi:trypsin-like serine peptidase [Kineococcus esterisolvens]|uniref:trypsin-like serine peptidase n=1 Tax=unclassified Kineococcus TaxID=2621656 RepID=UPI003D7C3C46